MYKLMCEEGAVGLGALLSEKYIFTQYNTAQHGELRSEKSVCLIGGEGNSRSSFYSGHPHLLWWDGRQHQVLGFSYRHTSFCCTSSDCASQTLLFFFFFLNVI